MTAARRALVVVDVQQEYFAGPLEIRYPVKEQSLAKIVEAIDTAVAAEIPVVIVQHHSPEGAPVFAEGTVGWTLHPEIGKRITPGTKLLPKQYSSAFAGTDLAEWLRARNVDTVTIVGFMTNNCDLATAAEAEGLGFAAEVLSDATGAVDLANEAGRVSARDLHTTLMVLLQSNWAAVATTAEWVLALRSGEALRKSNIVVSAMNGRTAATV
ncbi:cysteine hydrolase [Nocardia higoensis]|uniref:Cysteine hydrolase n=1 Tax=Nocardia higoensis TaxID=228599 RepID=A0ABS0DKE2_9NOCA|nr:cysteine hydrolase family protein [Nocardia higoensis]MBF6357163.1 cysteine hydrolase [Nocardia higoensis]